MFAEYAGPHDSILKLLRRANPGVDLERLKTAYRRVRVGDRCLTVGDDGRVALHKLDSDPGQRENVADESPQEVAALLAILDLEFSEAGASPREEPQLDEETRDKLRSLGYID